MSNVPMVRGARWFLETVAGKVPEVTLLFWVIKVLSTTVGETGADYLAVHVGLGTGFTMAIMVLGRSSGLSGEAGEFHTSRLSGV